MTLLSCTGSTDNACCPYAYQRMHSCIHAGTSCVGSDAGPLVSTCMYHTLPYPRQVRLLHAWNKQIHVCAHTPAGLQRPTVKNPSNRQNPHHITHRQQHYTSHSTGHTRVPAGHTHMPASHTSRCQLVTLLYASRSHFDASLLPHILEGFIRRLQDLL